MKKEINNDKFRISKPVIIVTFFLFIVLIIRLCYLCLFDYKVGNSTITAFIKNRNTTEEVIMPKRGTIYDVNGNILANDVISYTLIAYLSDTRVDSKGNKDYVEDIDDTSSKLADVLGASTDDIKSVLINGRENNKYHTYNGTSIDEMSMGSGTGGNIDESKFALKSDLDEFDPNAYKDEVNTFINEAKKDVLTVDRFDAFDTRAYEIKVNTFIDKAKKDILTIDRFDTFDTRAYEARVNTFIDEAKKDILTLDKFDTFDTRAFKSEVNVFINEAKKDILTIDKFDVFDPEAYKNEVNTYVNEAKKDLLTIDKFDVFDAEAYKQELQTIANEVTNKMSVFDGLTEIDLNELKAQLKAEILAELRTVVSADGAGA